ncbi:MAG: hypothetical protein MJ218_00565 [Opitutales bacterium]|nr:hypothetical protein [Opitutales bacterium]
MPQILKTLSTIKRINAYRKLPDSAKNQVLMDISQVCNAQCYFCPTGMANRNHAPVVCEGNRFMDVELFRRIIKDLKAKGFLTVGSELILYIWYEPLLHPEFAKIVEIANEEQCLLDLSTNANVLPSLPSTFDASPIMSMFISMCGFSQASYDRIHRFDFEHIKNNIRTLVRTLRQRGCIGRIMIRFHVYQFNIHEIPAAYEFAKSLNVMLIPYYAIPLDFKIWMQYIKNTLPQEYLKCLVEDLLMGLNAKCFKPSKTCYWFDHQLAMNAKGEIIACCNIQEPIGSVFDVTKENLPLWHQKVDFCKDCMSTGLVNYEGGDCTFFQPHYSWRVRRYWEIIKTALS